MVWQAQGNYSSCQLVAATNAALSLGTIKRRPTKKRWEELVDLTLCRAGSCLSVDKAHEVFEILAVPIPSNLASVRRHVRKGRPVECSVWIKRAGFHAVLVLAHGSRGYKCLNYHKGDRPTWIAAREFGEAFNHAAGRMVRPNCYFRRP